MKQFKITFALLGTLCFLILNGCVGGSNGGSGASSSSSSISTNSQNEKNSDQLLTSFTLWGRLGEESTANAGEIIGNNITVQVPDDTNLYTPLFMSYTDLSVTFKTMYGDEIPNGSPEYFFGSQSFIVTKNGNSQIYNVSVVKRAPYFKPYGSSNLCIQDLDGNIWLKFTPEWGSHNSTWQDNMSFIKTFSACDIPASKWTLPSLKQVKTLLNTLPLDYRSKSNESANLEPTDWFNQPKFGFQLTPGWAYWTSHEDKTISYNAYVLNISKQNTGTLSLPESSLMYPLPIYSGSESTGKTITSFSLNLENSLPLEGTIASNQIFVMIPTWVNPGSNINFNIRFSTTGDKVSSNGALLTNNSNTSYDIEQPIPITVTAKNGDKNIYTLIFKKVGIMPNPPKRPDVPGLITVCTSLGTLDPNKTFNRIVIVTLGNSFYKQATLPLPGTCSAIDLGKSIEDLAANNVLWWSSTKDSPIASTLYVDSTGYYKDIIPTFTWVPVPKSTDPSGFALTVNIDPTCHHDSQYPLGVTPSCTN
ncbi:MAG: hypothetical protein K0R49_678 [Burkholderiales bacterium]|jgi:hypothetical protein|nr:hypothetical protein [Burkholderiales bacterium]